MQCVLLKLPFRNYIIFTCCTLVWPLLIIKVSGVTWSKPGQARFKDFWAHILTWIERQRQHEQKVPKTKTWPWFLWQVFVNFMEKEPCTKFCGFFNRFHEVKTIQSFKFSVTDVAAANVQNMSPLVFFAFFVSFVEETPPVKFYGVFGHFSRTY